MWRILLIAILLVGAPAIARAQITGWESCRGALGPDGPVLSDCRPLAGPIDPQGRDLWLRGAVDRPDGEGPQSLHIIGVASSEAWLNHRRLGANGQPGGSAASEIPGLYQAALPIREDLWLSRENVLVIHLSSFRGQLHLNRPIAGIFVTASLPPSRPAFLAMTFVAAGALFAAAFGFGVIHSLRRTGSSLTLSVLALAAGLQAILESLRTLVPYAYPLHAWRLTGIWMLTAVFAMLLVSYVASRFWPQARRPILGTALAAVGCTCLAPGFDLKTALALIVGVALSTIAVAVAVVRRRAGARQMLAYFAGFVVIGAAYPAWLVDLSYFLFAAGLVLPLLMVEVVRLGRDDQEREVVLTRAVAQPNCLTVASSRGVERVLFTDIIAVVGADDYVELRLVDGRSLLHAARLDRLEVELPANFLRVHRSAIANLTHVRGFERAGGRGMLLMRESRPLPVSRNRLAAVRDAFDESVVSQSTM